MIPTSLTHTFSGWYIDKMFTTRFTETHMGESAIKIYGKWIPKP